LNYFSESSVQIINCVYDYYAVRLNTLKDLNHDVFRYSYTAERVRILTRAMKEYRRSSAGCTIFIKTYIETILISGIVIYKMLTV
jgi:hypothetical protein